MPPSSPPPFVQPPGTVIARLSKPLSPSVRISDAAPVAVSIFIASLGLGPPSESRRSVTAHSWPASSKESPPSA